MEPLFVDIHSHAVPSRDDGVQSAAEGVALCRDAAAHGTRVLFATPHVFEHLPLTEERERAVRAACDAVGAQAQLELRLGFELTPASPLLDEDPARYVLEGTDIVLVELPFAGPADGFRALADKARTIRMPVHIVERLQKMNRAERTLWMELGREPTLEDIGRRLGLTRERVRQIETEALKRLARLREMEAVAG